MWRQKLQELNSIQCEGPHDVFRVISRIEQILSTLKLHSITLDDEMVISTILKSLPSCFDTFLLQWQMKDAKDQTLKWFTGILQECANMLEENSSRTALVARENLNQPFQRSNFQKSQPNNQQNYPVENHGSQARNHSNHTQRDKWISLHGPTRRVYRRKFCYKFTIQDRVRETSVMFF